MLILAIACLLALLGAGPLAANGEAAEVAAGQLGAAEAEKVIAETSDFLVDLYWSKFDWYWHQGNYDKLIELGYLVIELDPHFVEPYTGAAWLLWSQKRHEEAEALYREGMRENPKDPDLPLEMGALYYHGYRRRPDLAVPLLRRAVANGGGINAQRALAHALRATGRFREEAAVWEQLLAKHPEDERARRQLEQARARLEERGSGEKGKPADAGSGKNDEGGKER
jgi:tetratricopeptide (TPR) repeat protein